ncbi:AsmA family protein [Azospirillum sp.]|uniref:AsmA family protein n=1 Tax=Azospirillum sp. TaxID=34012 RepID=UPI003D758478
MKKTLITLLILAVVLVAAVLAVPSFIDWNSYKAEIAGRVGAATGRTVEIRGDIRLSLLPRPALSVRDARLSNAPGAAEPDMLRLKELDATIAFWPLLEGKVTVESVTLVEPVLATEVLPDGRLNWDLSSGRAPASDTGSRPGEGLGGSVRFDDVQIRKGTILYRDAAGRTERAEHVDARVVANSLVGPFQVQGTFAWRGAALKGELIVGPIVENMAVPLRTTVGLADGDATLRLAGTVGGLLSLNLRAEGSDLARVVDALRGDGGTAPAVLAQPFALRAVVEAGAQGGYAVNGLEAQLGNTRATGTAGVRLKPAPDVTLALAVNRLDLDAWMQQAAPARATNVKGNGPAPAAPAPAAEVALPTDLTGRLDLSVEGIGYNGGLVRQLRVEAALANGTLNLDRLSALLPGGADFVTAGALTAAGGPPSVDLRVEANADNLRGLLDWLRVDAGQVPPDRLRKASLSARVQGRRDKLEVTGIDLRLDTSRLTGGVAYVDRGRPAFGIRAEVDRLVLDPYLPAFRSAPAPAKGAAPDPKAGPVPPGVDRLLKAVDANLDLTVQHLTVQGLPIQGLHLDATANAGTLTVREATVGDAAGVTAQLNGQIGGLSPLRITHLTFTAAADSLTGLPKIVAWPAGAPAPERIGPVKAQGRLAGDLERLAVELNLAAAGGTLDVGGAVTNLQHTAGADVKLRATYPETARLVALFGDGARPAREIGGIDLYAEAAGSAKAFALNNLQGLVAGTPVRGGAQVDLAGAKPRVQADLQTGDLDLDQLLAGPAAASRRPAGAPAAPGAPAADAERLDLGWMRGFDGKLGLTAAAIVAEGWRVERPALRAGLENGVLTLDQLDGGVLGGQVGATGRLTAGEGGGAQGELSVTLVKAKLAEALGGGAVDVAGGTLDLDLDLNTAGASRGALMQGLSGKGALHARDGLVRGFDMGVLRDRLTRVDRPQDALPAVLGALQGGQTRFARMDGTFAIQRGVARTEDLRLISEVGEATAVGQVDLPARTVDMRVRVAARADQPLPPVSLRLTGPLDQPTRAFEMQEVQEFLARRAAGAVLDKVVPQVPGLPLPGGAAPQEMIRGLLDGLKR